LERTWRTACEARTRASPGVVCEGVAGTAVAFPSQRRKGQPCFKGLCGRPRMEGRGRDTGSPRGTGATPPKQGKRWAWRSGAPSEVGAAHKPCAPRESISCKGRKRSAHDVPIAWRSPSLPPPRAPPRGMRARAAPQSGCNVRAPRVAHHACLRAARSRACAFAHAIARASVNAQRKRRTDARCAIAWPEFQLPSLCACLPTALLHSLRPVSALSLCSVRVRYLVFPTALCFAPSSSCARSTRPPPPAPVPLPPPCRPFPTPAVLSALAFRWRASRWRVVLLARASATLSVVTLSIAAVMQ